MKKTVVFLSVLAFAASVAYADSGNTGSSSGGGFWQKEGERSGLKESTSSWGKFWESANPVAFFKNQQDAYNARKTGAKK